MALQIPDTIGCHIPPGDSLYPDGKRRESATNSQPHQSSDAADWQERQTRQELKSNGHYRDASHLQLMP